MFLTTGFLYAYYLPVHSFLQQREKAPKGSYARARRHLQLTHPTNFWGPSGFTHNKKTGGGTRERENVLNTCNSYAQQKCKGGTRERENVPQNYRTLYVSYEHVVWDNSRLQSRSVSVSDTCLFRSRKTANRQNTAINECLQSE